MLREAFKNSSKTRFQTMLGLPIFHFTRVAVLRHQIDQNREGILISSYINCNKFPCTWPWRGNRVKLNFKMYEFLFLAYYTLRKLLLYNSVYLPPTWFNFNHLRFGLIRRRYCFRLFKSIPQGIRLLREKSRICLFVWRNKQAINITSKLNDFYNFAEEKKNKII